MNQIKTYLPDFIDESPLKDIPFLYDGVYQIRGGAVICNEGDEYKTIAEYGVPDYVGNPYETYQYVFVYGEIKTCTYKGEKNHGTALVIGEIDGGCDNIIVLGEND